MENRPVAAYTLAMIGVALQVVAAFFVIYIFTLFPTIPMYMMGRWMRDYLYTYRPVWVFIWITSALIVISLGVYGAVSMNSTNLYRVRVGTTMVLIASIIAFPMMWGFMIGSLLMFIGSLLGLTWQPTTSTQEHTHRKPDTL